MFHEDVMVRIASRAAAVKICSSLEVALSMLNASLSSSRFDYHEMTKQPPSIRAVEDLSCDSHHSPRYSNFPTIFTHVLPDPSILS